MQLLKEGTLKMQHTTSYCQGMNYIGGMLIYQQLSVEESLELYTLLIERKMLILFDENLTYLKNFFFVLEKLMALFLKEISEDFKVN